jgi:serine/threonine protein kinase
MRLGRGGWPGHGIVLANIPSAMSKRVKPKLELVNRTPDSASEPVSAVRALHSDDVELQTSALGSGLLARQPTPPADEAIAVAKVCPQCGSEYETGDRFCPKDGTSLRPKTGGDPLIGRVIADRYLVLAKLGEGGMGRVYLAEHVKMTRQCAVKVMNPSLMNDSESLARFAREASSAARIIHPNVAAVFDYGEADRIVYLVMEYVDGEPLSTILAREGPLDPRRAIDIARQIADGLAAAHELGIVHRDLKPDNVIISRTRGGKEVPKVVDFGIAKALSDSPKDALTRSGLVIGTPEYMSPEQLLGDPVDQRTDIYALGCILYQMLTGVQAFAADTREQMIRRRLHETPPHARDALPDLPRRLDTLIVHMLARSPGDRLGSASEARDAFDPALALNGWNSPMSDAAATGAPLSRTTLMEPEDPSLSPTALIPQQRTGRSRWGIVVLGGAAVLLALVLVTPRLEDKLPAAPVPAFVPAPIPQATVADSAAVQPPSTQAPVLHVASDTTKKSAPVRKDSAGRTADGNVKTVQAPTDAGAVRETLERFAAASARGVAALTNAVPALTAQQKDVFQRVYSTGESIHSSSRIGDPVVTGSRAEVPFTLVMTYLDKVSKTQSSVRLEYRAVLMRRAKQWEIAELKAP